MIEVLGAVVSVAALAIITALIVLALRAIARRGRIRWAGWAPWWYVGGQPDVPPELQRERRKR